MPTHGFAYAKVKNWIFPSWFPGNGIGFGIISNDFWSSTIWASQIHVSYPEIKNPKNPGIQPIHVLTYSHIKALSLPPIFASHSCLIKSCSINHSLFDSCLSWPSNPMRIPNSRASLTVRSNRGIPWRTSKNNRTVLLQGSNYIFPVKRMKKECLHYDRRTSTERNSNELMGIFHLRFHHIPVIL